MELRQLLSSQAASYVAGTATGIVVGDYVGEYVKVALGQTGWAGVAVSAGTKMGVSAAAYYLTKRFVRSPWWRSFGFSAAIGALVSIVLDIINTFMPGGAKAKAASAAMKLRGWAARPAPVAPPASASAPAPVPAPSFR